MTRGSLTAGYEPSATSTPPSHRVARRIVPPTPSAPGIASPAPPTSTAEPSGRSPSARPSATGSARSAVCTGADETFAKQVGFADFYFGADGYAHKMGILQSLPVPGPLLTAKMAPWLPGCVLGFLRRRM